MSYEQSEKEIVIEFANKVLDAADALNLSMDNFISYLIHIIGCSLRSDVDEEDLRDLARTFHCQIYKVMEDRRNLNEPMQKLQD